MRRALAVDIGASSGRHIAGWFEGGALRTEEVFRFENSAERRGGSLVWDIERIFQGVKDGIRAAFARYGGLDSIACDTWAVDYVLLSKAGSALSPVFAYRDRRTEPVIPEVHKRIPFEILYERTGIQFQSFNTIYQLYADKVSGKLEEAAGFLMIPEYLSWRLCGAASHEYTNAVSTGLVNAFSGEYDGEIIRALGFPPRLFGPLSQPGRVLGPLLPPIAAETGGNAKVLLCASHDTASAFEGVGVIEGVIEGVSFTQNSAFLSSGTWSLLGVKLDKPLTDEQSRLANFTNEGGPGYVRYLKNIMGLWLLQNLHKELGLSYAEMEALSRESAFTQTFDVSDKRFLSPADMRREIIDALGGRPLADKDVISSVYHSLAKSYAAALTELERNTGRKYDTLYIAGGGAKDKRLASLTERYTGKKVVREPVEAAALGNLKIQLQALEETDGAL